MVLMGCPSKKVFVDEVTAGKRFDLFFAPCCREGCRPVEILGHDVAAVNRQFDTVVFGFARFCQLERGEPSP